MTDTTGRLYGGRSEAERRADRRARLVEAGLELFGTEGWQAASIERLCTQASVATRSFYEEFTGREPLMQAVYDQVMGSATEVVLDALARADGGVAQRLSVAVDTYLTFITEDLRRARVVHQEVRAVGTLEAHRHRALVRFSEVVQLDLIGHGPPPEDAVRRRLLSLALAGALSELLVDWVAGPVPRPALDPLRDELLRIYTAALLPLSGGDGWEAYPRG